MRNILTERESWKVDRPLGAATRPLNPIETAYPVGRSARSQSELYQPFNLSPRIVGGVWSSIRLPPRLATSVWRLVGRFPEKGTLY